MLDHFLKHSTLGKQKTELLVPSTGSFPQGNHRIILRNSKFTYVHLWSSKSAELLHTYIQIHQGKSKWHSYHVLVYISPVLTYLFETVPCTLTVGYIYIYFFFFPLPFLGSCVFFCFFGGEFRVLSLILKVLHLCSSHLLFFIIGDNLFTPICFLQKQHGPNTAHQHGEFSVKKKNDKIIYAVDSYIHLPESTKKSIVLIGIGADGLFFWTWYNATCKRTFWGGKPKIETWDKSIERIDFSRKTRYTTIFWDSSGLHSINVGCPPPFLRKPSKEHGWWNLYSASGWNKWLSKLVMFVGAVKHLAVGSYLAWYTTLDCLDYDSRLLMGNLC